MGNFTNSKEVVAAWMKSSDHRENILDSNYHDMGIAITRTIIKGTYTLLITQHFGTPRKDCPAIDEHKRTSVASLQGQLVATLNLVEEQRKIIGDYEKDNYVTDDEYNVAIEIHNQLVERYNALGGTLEQLVNAYNLDVKNFESCKQHKGIR